MHIQDSLPRTGRVGAPACQWTPSCSSRPRFGGFHMDTIIGRFSPQAFAIMRIVVGLLFACHGSQKLFGWPGGPMGQLPALLMVGAIIELVGGLLIAVGFLTGWAAFIASGEMAVAYF